jgi:DNA replication protein
MEKAENIEQTIIPGFSISDSEELCSKHHIRLLVGKLRKHVYSWCPKCAQEKKEEEDRRMSEEVLMKVMARDAYGWIERFSLVPDTTLWTASFNSYIAKEEEEIKNKFRAVQAYQRLKNGEKLNLWFAGKQGAGKSHLAMSILRNLNDMGKKELQDNMGKGIYEGGYKCLFINFEEMLREIRNNISHLKSFHNEAYFIHLLSQADFLVIDDLGAETGSSDTDKSATDFVHRVLYAIGNARQNKSTMLTTNLTGQQLQQKYDRKVLSRFLRNVTQIVFKETKDHRANTLRF